MFLGASLMRWDGEVRMRWAPREQNTWADALSKGEVAGFDPARRKEVPWSKLGAIEEFCRLDPKWGHPPCGAGVRGCPSGK